MRQQQGLSLIEMMIVVAIFSLLAMAGLSFSTSWVNSNRVMEGENLVFQAFSRTKAAALRNQFGITGDQAAAAMCYSNNVLSVHHASSGTAANCATTPSWSIELPAPISLEVNGATLSCACLSSKGRLTQTGCSTCITSASLRLVSGDENATLSLL